MHQPNRARLSPTMAAILARSEELQAQGMSTIEAHARARREIAGPRTQAQELPGMGSTQKHAGGGR
jgi:hypothetical protein